MSKYSDDIFRYKKPNREKLVDYGFRAEGDKLVYTRVLTPSEFELTVAVTHLETVEDWVIDPAFGEPYTLHLVSGITGEFVGEIKREYIDLLEDIAQNCFEKAVYKSPQTLELLECVKSEYNTELEFLWSRSQTSSVLRRQDTEKWFAAILVVSERKLGLDSDTVVEVIDLRTPPESMSELLSQPGYYPGYHMNKKNWYTIILDGSISTEKLMKHIKDSYDLAVK